MYICVYTFRETRAWIYFEKCNSNGTINSQQSHLLQSLVVTSRYIRNAMYIG